MAARALATSPEQQRANSREEKRLPPKAYFTVEQTKKPKTRKVHTPEFKAKVGLEALRGVKTINEIGQEHGVHPVQVGQWKKAIQEQAKTLFEGKRGPKPVAAHREPELLYSEIGKLKVELDWLKKKSGISLS
jgi:transposase